MNHQIQQQRLALPRARAIVAATLLISACGGVRDVPDANPTDTADATAAQGSCQEYCSVIGVNCVDVNAQYTNNIECKAYCEQWAGLPLGQVGETDGNSVACRTYHATVASTDPATHCPHAGKTGANVCGSWCVNFCHLALRNCPSLFGDEPECLATCAGLDMSGQPGATDGNTIQCRIHYLGLAGTEPPGSQAMYCPLAGVMPSSGCVDPDANAR